MPIKSAAWVAKWNETFRTDRQQAVGIRICSRWYVRETGDARRGQKRVTIPCFVHGLDGRENVIDDGSERDLRRQEVAERRRVNHENDVAQNIAQARAASEFHLRR